MIFYEKIEFIIKSIALLLLLLNNYYYYDFFFIKYKSKNILEIDNEIITNIKEKDISFIKYKTKFKAIAFYHPEYINISYFKYFRNNKKQFEFNDESLERLIKKQTELAKNHGIYGFAIYFNLSNFSYYNKIITFFLNKIIFPFFLIWRNKESKIIGEMLIEKVINIVKIFFSSVNYIKIREKPVLSISDPYVFNNPENVILKIRKKAKKYSLGEIFIFYPFTGNLTEKKFLDYFDAAYDFSKIDLIQHIIVKPNILYYTGFIYKNLLLNELNFNFSLFRSCSLNYKDFNDYNPEKFYLANNLIFDSEINNYKQNYGIIFINSWNNYKSGNYLEPNEKYGYASINSFSKSIFNLPYQQNNFSLYQLYNNTIAIHIHAFYEDIFKEIINKLNFIHLKYDLFVSTVSKEKRSIIENYLINSNVNSYEIKIYQNIGRDVFPFIKQMKKKFKYYKYICHIHTKKSNHKSLLGANWRNYMYSNLLGNDNVISEILFDFEFNEKLGFIFPETYYDLIKDVYGFDNINFSLNEPNKKYINFILKKIAPKFKPGEKLAFPAGNMFWAKTDAIHQIFNISLRYPRELNQTNETIMHGIERVWLYLVKLNGYYYKSIIKYY